jgi:Uma2 family endonuclease
MKKRRTITPQQFLRHEEEFGGFELVDGHLEKKAISAVSSNFNYRCAKLLGDYVDARKLGYIFESECQYQCCPSKPDQIRKPDVSFIRMGRFPGEILPIGVVTIPPDFMIEVVSKNENVAKLDVKIEEFLEAGTPLIWVVNSFARTVFVHRPGLPIERMKEPSILSAEPVVPGFTVAVADLFPPKDA